MAFTKITDADLQGKGVVGQAAVPGLPVKEMQESVEQIVREVAIPGINRLADELGAQTAAKNIGMQVPDGMPGGASANVSSIVATHVLAKGNPHNVTAEQVGAYTKEQTDQAINQKVQDIGSGDMSKAEYAPTGTYGAVDRALSADNASQSDDGVKVYTHTKSGTVHNFAGSGANGRAKLTADVQAGDTFTVNGAPVTAYMGADDAAVSMEGSEWNGKWVGFIIDGSVLSFSGGAKHDTPAYSTSKWVDTGEKWIDGKPIYQKVLTGKIVHDEYLPADIDALISLSGHGYVNAVGQNTGGAHIYVPSVAKFQTATTYGDYRWYILNETYNGQLNDAEVVIKATLKP
ncbi:hypothetical protein [Candidatus Allofournierella merdipullorum]|uniref:hypothetical protein n=1 Tax=Candidatus Allofournierella merdipullorum TaxID=2838595 RepID=UPI002A8B178A|nr:hypothetical protein [Candidatus Fournierella merdipullorum]